MVSPFLDLTEVSDAELSFDLAYAPKSNAYLDGLAVRVSTDCGHNFTDIYAKTGLDLSTNGGNGVGTGSYVGDAEWSPNCSDWGIVNLDLTAYVGQIVQFKFVNINAHGQSIFIDNIHFRGTECTPISTTINSLGLGCYAENLSVDTAPNGYDYQWFNNGLPVSDSITNNYTAFAEGDYTVGYVNGACHYDLSPIKTVHLIFFN